MRQATDIVTANPVLGSNLMAATGAGYAESAEARESQYQAYKIIRRNGSIAPFAPDKIAIALTKAFLAVNGGHEAASARMRDQVRELSISRSV